MTARAITRQPEWSAWRAAWKTACLVPLFIDTCAVLVAVVALPLSPPLKQRMVSRATRRFARRALAVLQIHVTVAGCAPDRPSLLACNHLSWIDILIAHVCFPDAAFVAKSDVATWPVIGSASALGGAIFVDRTRKRDLLHSLPVMRETLLHRHVVLFAEGTTTDGSCTLPFKSSLFESAVSAAAPVVPVAFRISAPDDSPRTRSHICWYGETSLLTHIPRLAGLREVHITVRVGDAVPMSVVDDVESLPHAKPSSMRKTIARAAHRMVSRAARESRLRYGFPVDDNSGIDGAAIVSASSGADMGVDGFARCGRTSTVTANEGASFVGSSRVDLQACKLEYSIVSPK